MPVQIESCIKATLKCSIDTEETGMSDIVFMHPFGDKNSPDAEEYLHWIRTHRIPQMTLGAERCHIHLQTCPECLQRFLSRLADPLDTDNYFEELLYLYELSEILDRNQSE